MMNYCVECGHRLELRHLENEGEIPYCPQCGAFRFPIFNTAVSMEVVDEAAKKVLLIQQYGRARYILVAGYVNRGEAAEHAVAREVWEEVGLEAERVEFNRSEFFEPSNTLMLNFACYVKDGSALHLNGEVDSCRWFTYEEARQNIFPGSLAERFLCAWLDKQKN